MFVERQLLLYETHLYGGGSMTNKLSVVAIQSLKEALCTIYWYKSDLKFFFDNCINDKEIIREVNWENLN